jgi:aryl-alcohol dehydrogenase-like predicted oxidoreductase
LTEADDNSRLILGTAQLGMPYGIANRIGQPGPLQAKAIIKAAWEQGVLHFDTAQDYGESEILLGHILSDLGIAEEARITTKLHPDIDLLNDNEVSQAVERSIQTLKIAKLFCLMLHREHHLNFLGKGLGVILKNLISGGYTENIGISVYSPQAAIAALRSDIMHIVQLPANILDRRFEKAGVFQEAIAKEKKIHIRSIFLQGLILMETQDLPEDMAFALPAIRQLEKLAEEKNMTRTALALHYVKMKYPESCVVFGAESPDQVRENCSLWRWAVRNDIVAVADGLFSAVDERILNPTLWH